MNIQNTANEVAETGQDDRLEHQATALKDIGDVSQITQTTFNGDGSDMSHS